MDENQTRLGFPGPGHSVDLMMDVAKFCGRGLMGSISIKPGFRIILGTSSITSGSSVNSTGQSYVPCVCVCLLVCVPAVQACDPSECDRGERRKNMNKKVSTVPAFSLVKVMRIEGKLFETIIELIFFETNGGMLADQTTNRNRD